MNQFVDGFRKALRLWRDGYTWELITHHESCDASFYGNGMRACVDALSGWLDSARLLARFCGLDRLTAEQLIAECLEGGK